MMGLCLLWLLENESVGAPIWRKTAREHFPEIVSRYVAYKQQAQRAGRVRANESWLHLNQIERPGVEGDQVSEPI